MYAILVMQFSRLMVIPYGNHEMKNHLIPSVIAPNMVLYYAY